VPDTHRSIRFPWRLFWLLFGAGVVGVLAIIPFALDLIGPTLPPMPDYSLPLPLIIAIGIVQNLVLLGVMVFVGLKLGRQLGLGAPLLDAWINNVSSGDFKKSLRSGLIVGIVIGMVLLAIVLLLVPALPKLPFVAAARIALWKRMLVCLYGGIYEELLTRLFLLTLIAWLATKLLRKDTQKLTATSFWIANLTVAVLFGLGHLPSASLVMPITALVVVAAISLNGIAAIAFGWLYRKHGLESAMIAHFVADFVLYVVGVSFL
jgi:hypothetical protein